MRRFASASLAAALAAALAALAAAPARAGFQRVDLGASGAQFLKLGAGARAEGLGGALVAAADEADAIDWNPAALTRVARPQAAFMHSALPAGIDYEWLGFGRRLRDWGGFGASARSLSQPSIDVTDSAGDSTGATFRPNDFSASLGGAYRVRNADAGIFDGASFGASAKYVSETITRTVSTFAADLGFVSGPIALFGRPLRLAYVAQNLGGTLKFRELADPLPTNLRFGTSYEPLDGWLLALDVDEPVDNRPYAAFGTEYSTEVADNARVAARLGVNSRAYGEAGALSGLSLGLGGRFSRWGVDYAFVPLGSLGARHDVSLSYSF